MLIRYILMRDLLSATLVINHLRAHADHKRGKQTCNLCHLSYYDLKKHVKNMHEEKLKEKAYQCHICKYQGVSVKYLRKHIKIHSGEKRHICEYCTKSFGTSGNLRIHWRKHTGEKPFSCKQCTFSTSQSGTLKRHVETHNNCD